jgi:peptidoglycan/xylan/chitin deacetylase (PgdA/CDA1 family)
MDDRSFMEARCPRPLVACGALLAGLWPAVIAAETVPIPPAAQLAPAPASLLEETPAPAFRLNQPVSIAMPGSEAPSADNQNFAMAKTPKPVRRAAPAQWNSVNTTRPVIALTFDDGPHPELTPKLLEILRANGVKATFYVIGRNVDAYPEIARRIVQEGHEIANHSYNHPALTKLSPARLDEEIRSTNEAIERATGVRPTNMRPPYGAINDRVRQTLTGKFGLDVMIWSVDPLDWKRPGPAVVTQRMVSGAKPGGILLAHDIHPGTVTAMPETIRQLKARGFEFATISELLALHDPSLPPEPSPAKDKPGLTQTAKAVPAEDGARQVR